MQQTGLLQGKTPVYSVNGSENPDSWNYEPCHCNSIDGTISMDLNASGYRLPTEAEWEYAAKGGKKSKSYKYSGSNDLERVAWNNIFSSNTHYVAAKSSNDLRLYDMSGNVWEWCWDWYNSGYYSKRSASNPIGATSGFARVQRGGSHCSSETSCRVTKRGYANPSAALDDVGFRIVRSAQ